MYAQTKSAPRATNAGATTTTEDKSMSQNQDIPNGFCQCGCGGKTRQITHTDRWRGEVHGEYRRFINHHNRRVGDDQRFDGRYVVEDCGYESSCWVWRGVMKPNTNYGRFTVYVSGRRHQWQAHRWSYTRFVGEIPDGMDIDHLCGNPSCVNPEHLEPVTNRENRRRAGQIRLTESQARDIKGFKGMGAADVAAKFGVHPATVADIWAGRSWRDA